ncbi:MAG TPA: citrate synthase [Deltaproteobacteria bacterium]|nr:citrate synthase [Deltaproteobacteria bacterium]
MEVVPGLEGIPAAESAISFIDGEKGILEYRGIPIEELVEKSTYLEVVYLLIFGRLPTRSEFERFRNDVTYHTRLKLKLLRMMETLPETGHPMEYLQAATSAMGMYYQDRDPLDEQCRYWSIVRLVAKLPTIVAACQRLRHGDAPILPDNSLSFAANFHYILFEDVPDEMTEKIIDVLLILHADHTMNASTFSARVVGSTLADPYTVVASAIGSLSGPLHGGANEKVIHMLREIGTKENVRPYIEDKIARKERIMGIGHRIYKTKDPRANILQKYAHQLFESARSSQLEMLEVAEEVEKVVVEKLGHKGLYPNVDFYSGIVFHGLGIPTDLFTPFFAMSRVSGWLAHWKEQLKTNRIYRPEQKYVGLRNRPYVPMDERGD